MTATSKKLTKVPSKTSITLQTRLLWICNTVFHQAVAVLGVFVLWTLSTNFQHKLSSWHMVLTATAYIPVMAEAIILFSTDNLWTQSIPRQTRYALHGALLFLSAILATIGISFMIYSKTTTHFQTPHAWLGLVSWICVLLSQFLGICSARAHSLSFLLRPVWFKFIHNFFGILGYTFGLCSLAFGLKKHTFMEASSEESRTAGFVLIGIIGVWSLLAAFKSAFNQLKSIFT